MTSVSRGQNALRVLHSPSEEVRLYVAKISWGEICYDYYQMGLLKRYDFNKWTGWLSIIFVSIGISFVIFAIVYFVEGNSWLAAYKEEALDTYKEIGQNWVRGGVIALVSSAGLFFLSSIMLGKNKRTLGVKPPIWGKLDFNNRKCAAGLVFFSVAFTFFFNAALYRYEYTIWVLSGIAEAKQWYLAEASTWASAMTTMALIGAFLSAIGWVCIVMGWKRKQQV